jgi:hypothetical protein
MPGHTTISTDCNSAIEAAIVAGTHGYTGTAGCTGNTVERAYAGPYHVALPGEPCVVADQHVAVQTRGQTGVAAWTDNAAHFFVVAGWFSPTTMHVLLVGQAMLEPTTEIDGTRYQATPGAGLGLGEG